MELVNSRVARRRPPSWVSRLATAVVRGLARAAVHTSDPRCLPVHLSTCGIKGFILSDTRGSPLSLRDALSVVSQIREFPRSSSRLPVTGPPVEAGLLTMAQNLGCPQIPRKK